MSTALVVQENKNEIKVNDGELTIDTKNENKIEGKMEGKARVNQPPSTLSLSVSGAGGGVGVGDKNNSKDRDKDKSNNNNSSHSNSKSTPHECPVVSAIAVQQQFSQAEHFRKLWESLR